jgi:CHAT domain-containing protein
MPHDTPKKINIEKSIEDTLRRYFGDSLSPPQRTVAANISREVYYSVADGKTPLTTWQARVSTLQQQWQNPSSTPPALTNFAQLFLQLIAANAMQNIFDQSPEEYYKEGVRLVAQIATGVTDAGVKRLILGICFNAGITQGQLGNLAAELESYQHGLTHAHAWLAELTPDAKETVLQLSDGYSSTCYNSHQIAQVISLLPDKGLWSWVGFKYSDAQNKQKILYNWRNKLEIQYRPAQLIAAFQQCFYTLLTRDHAPTQSVRPFGFITTEVLLQLSETLYALDQARDNARLQAVYRTLNQLTEYYDLTHLRHVFAQYQQFEHEQPKWGWIGRWLHEWRRSKIAQQFQQIQQRILQDSEWHTMDQAVETAFVDWIHANCRTHLHFSDSISDFPQIILAMLLIGNGSDSAVNTVRTWHTAPPWHDRDTLQTALSATQYQHWLDEKNRPLSFWKSLCTSQLSFRLRIDFKIANQSQPELQTELRQPEQLLEKLAVTWQQLQHAAHPLARLLAAFDTLDFQHADIEAIIDAPLPNETHFHAALVTVILGDIEQQLEQAIRDWLQFTPLSDSPLDTVAAQHHRFTRAVPIYSKTHHAVLAQQVHDWSKVRLREIFQHEAGSFPRIWALLERNRVGLHSLTTHLSENWEEKLSQLLWKDLELMVTQLASGYEPKDNEMWQPLQTWITYFDSHLHTARVLDWKRCQMRLRPGEALLQPFFHEDQQRYCILWLDKNKLQLLDFPDSCALGSDWDTFMNRWHTALVDESTDQLTPLFENSVFSRAAHHLAEIAQFHKITQLTIIFPAPLGQLPWEALPALENLLVREISLNHWYQNQESEKTGAWVLGMGNIARELGCCNSEARWVADCWQTTATCPDQPLETFEVLQRLATQQRLFLSTHAGFNPNDPLASGLLLGQHKTDGKATVDLPLWLCSAISTPCELLVLSACESNLTGEQTQGILSPVGIAPSFAAAGARTVIGTLWKIKDLTSLCFHYHLFSLEKTHPNLPWHQRMALARRQLRKMTIDDLKKLRTELKIQGGQENTTKCFAATANIIDRANCQQRLPFANPREWAAFTICGKT